MRKRPPIVEWHIAESDAEWEAVRSQSAVSSPPAQRCRWLPLCLVMLLVSVGVWLRLRAAVPPQAGITPNPAVDWGTVEQLTTTHFTLHFYQRDATTVATVAPRLEQFYTTLQQDLGVYNPDAPPLAITVSTTRTLSSAPYRPQRLTALRVASPTLYPAQEWEADAVLAQSLALPLIDHTLALAVRQYAIDPARQPLLDGLRLWQVWAADLPLARWQPALVQWIYVTLPTAATTTLLPLPTDYAALCAAHQLWMVYPEQLRIPLLCQGMDESPRRLSYTMIRQAPRRLPALDTPVYPDEEVDAAGQRTVTRHPGYAIAVATIIDYVEQRYGRAYLPRLIAAWGSSATWAELTPTLFGLPAAEFERDWQAFLADQTEANGLAVMGQ